MIQRVAAVVADTLAMFRSGIEYQHGAGGCVCREGRKHSTLIIVVEVTCNRIVVAECGRMCDAL
jgi:hypothetical protein